MNKNETREEYNARMREYMRTQYKKKRDEQVRQWKETAIIDMYANTIWNLGRYRNETV